MTTEHHRHELSRARAHSAAYLLISVLVVATALRAAITAVGPVIDLVAADTGLTEAALGLLGAIPLVAFAVVSPVVHLLARRVGIERTMLIALTVLAAATVLRSVPGWDGWLWVGTAIIGATIAVGNVLVPAILKRDSPGRIAVATGLFSAVMSAFAALASGLALPISDLWGWRVGLGIWAVLAVVAAIVWLPRVMRSEAIAIEPVRTASGSMWTSWTAWQVAVFMGAQSLTFYLMATWLPTVEVATGQSPVAAGWHLFALQLAGVVGGLAIPLFMRGRADLRGVVVGVTGALLLAMVGMLLAPDLVLIWAVLAGASTGASLVVALTFIGQRVRNPADAGRLSGFAQGVGYLLATLGPIGAGALLQATGAWQSVIAVAVAAALVQGAAGLLAGRDRYTHPA